MSVIREELAKSGVRLAGKPMPLDGVQLPAATSQMVPPRPAGPFQIDGADPQHRIAVEFVSTADAQSIKPDQGMSSVSTIDALGAAEVVNDALRAQARSQMYFGVLYDPCTFIMPDRSQPMNWDEHRQATRQASLEQLRAQVQDFLSWLRAQGAI